MKEHNTGSGILNADEIFSVRREFRIDKQTHVSSNHFSFLSCQIYSANFFFANTTRGFFAPGWTKIGCATRALEDETNRHDFIFKYRMGKLVNAFFDQSQ